MTGAGETSAALAAARDQLAVRDAGIAALDDELLDALRDAHRLAGDCLRRLDAMQTRVDAAAAAIPAGGAAAGELSRFLVDRNREAIAVIIEAKAAAAAKAVVLQQLGARYRNCTQG